MTPSVGTEARGDAHTPSSMSSLPFRTIVSMSSTDPVPKIPGSHLYLGIQFSLSAEESCGEGHVCTCPKWLVACGASSSAGMEHIIGRHLRVSSLSFHLIRLKFILKYSICPVGHHVLSFIFTL